MFKPQALYCEKNIEKYPLGKELLEKYADVPKIIIDNHNNIEEMRKKQNSEFANMKRNLIIATRKTIGQYKTEVMRDRILEINPKADVRIHKCFFLPENADEFPFDEYDYIVDAVDTVTAKIELVMKANEMNIPIISSMGAGNKLEPSMFQVADIYKTKVCPLAKVMRRELKKRGIKKLKVVYSEEKPVRPLEDMAISCRTNCICPPGAQHKCTERRVIPGSTAFVPSVVGLIIAGEVVKDLCDYKRRDE